MGLSSLLELTNSNIRDCPEGSLLYFKIDNDLLPIFLLRGLSYTRVKTISWV